MSIIFILDLILKNLWDFKCVVDHWFSYVSSKSQKMFWGIKKGGSFLKSIISVSYSAVFSGICIPYLETQEGTCLWLQNHSKKWRIYLYRVYSQTNPNLDMSNVLFLVFCSESIFFHHCLCSYLLKYAILNMVSILFITIFLTFSLILFLSLSLVSFQDSVQYVGGGLWWLSSPSSL